jgi:hypothetical protein
VAERATEAGGFLSSALLDGPMLVAKCATSTSMATATAIHHMSYTSYIHHTNTFDIHAHVHKMRHNVHMADGI